MSVPVQHPMYIDGQFVTWRGDAWIDVVNPATEAVISRIPDGQAEDARKAIDAAERAQPEWEALPAIERASWLRKISAGIRERASEISALIVEEGGKIQQLAEVEVAFTATISITWRSGHGVTRARLFKAIVQEKIFFCLNVRLV
ncbi:aldehyde dehydrogenase A [Escherichia coli]|uniref:Aldehyde dehydrogenase A n=1 Tax=Escherichia coli TaxID=562 RepID=A0A377DSP6_ECOLX|nr:aldehyde dehydrogenase A [Escherichia coli]